jgi:hypothetical protein
MKEVKKLTGFTSAAFKELKGELKGEQKSGMCCLLALVYTFKHLTRYPCATTLLV